MTGLAERVSQDGTGVVRSRPLVPDGLGPVQVAEEQEVRPIEEVRADVVDAAVRDCPLGAPVSIGPGKLAPLDEQMSDYHDARTASFSIAPNLFHQGGHDAVVVRFAVE